MEVLIIDDHPTQIDGYKSILSFSEINETLEFTTCNNCREAHNLVTAHQNKHRFHIYHFRDIPSGNIFIE